MHQFSGQSSENKIKFLFKVYDLDGKFNAVMCIENVKTLIFFSLCNNVTRFNVKNLSFCLSEVMD